MKIARTMKLERLQRSTCLTASTPATWRTLRRRLVAEHEGRDTKDLTLGEWWAVWRAVERDDRAAKPVVG